MASLDTNALSDAAMLAEILSGADPRFDSDTAQGLIGLFGSLRAVLGADERRLARALYEYPGALQRLLLLRAVGWWTLRQKIERRRLQSWSVLVPYLSAKMSTLTVERMHFLFLDKNLHLLAEEESAAGTIDHCQVYVREVVGRAIEHGAKVLIMAHNHPSGTLSPSLADIDITSKIRNALMHVDITLADHILVSRAGCVSMAQHGLLGSKP